MSHGPVPKPAQIRQRKNRASSAAVLPSEAAAAKNRVPPLPPRERSSERWHAKVVAWWAAVWRSPMASEYLPSDRQGLYVLAELYQQLYAGDGKRLAAIAAEIRQQEARFGLSPVDRRRLQWEIERGDQADERTRRRRGLREVEGKDPREVLRVVGSTSRPGRGRRRQTNA